MKISLGKIVWIILVIAFLISIYPKRMTLAPEVELTVFRDTGEIAENAEVRRSWVSYAGGGWKVNHLTTDNNGKVKFERVQIRVPIIWERFNYYLPLILMHENNSNVGSFTARDFQNHFIYGSVDYKDEDCCPTKIVMTKQKLELEDSYFGFGELVSE